MIKTLIKDSRGNININSLRRYVRSGLVVPSQANLISRVPKAVGSNPGSSLPIVLEGPQDGYSELYSFNGLQGAAVSGTGALDSLLTTVTGTGTKFTSELAIGDRIISDGQTRVVASVTSDTILDTTVAFSPVLAADTFVRSIPVNTDVRDRMTVEITDTAFSRRLMNQPVPVDHIFGSNLYPGFLEETILLEKNQTLMFKFYNNSTAADGSFCLSSEGRKWGAEVFERDEVRNHIVNLRGRKYVMQPYWLTLDAATSITAGSRASQFMTCTGDITLILFTRMGRFLSSGAAGDIREGLTLEMQNTRTGIPYQNQPITINTGCGDAGRPYRFHHPIILDPQSQIKVDFTNLITDQSTDAFLTLGGVAVLTGRSALTDPAIINEANRIYNEHQSPVSEACRF